MLQRHPLVVYSRYSLIPDWSWLSEDLVGTTPNWSKGLVDLSSCFVLKKSSYLSPGPSFIDRRWARSSNCFFSLIFSHGPKSERETPNGFWSIAGKFARIAVHPTAFNASHHGCHLDGSICTLKAGIKWRINPHPKSFCLSTTDSSYPFMVHAACRRW